MNMTNWKDIFPKENRYFETENGILYIGDQLEIMKQFPNEIFDVIITDPPYGTTECKWDSVIPFEDMWNEIKRVRKKYIAIVIFGSEPFSTLLRMSNIDEYKYDWYWVKERPSGFLHAKNMPLKFVELISVFSDGVINHSSLTDKRMKYFPQGVEITEKKTVKSRHERYGPRPNQIGKQYQSYRNYPRNLIFFNKDKYPLHPTQKPLSLLEYLIRTYTQEGELVLDFTSGSGTTLVASEKLNRRWIGIEIEPKYCEITKKRLEDVIYT